MLKFPTLPLTFFSFGEVGMQIRWALLTLLVLMNVKAFGQAVEVTDDSAPQTGRAKAQEYFQTRKASTHRAANPERQPASEGDGGAPRYLAVQFGTYFSDNAYAWGHGDQRNLGQLDAAVTYRLGEWVNTMDFALRVNYTDYNLSEGHARKLSFGGILTFPDANSRFPLYFGAGLGAGFFLQQIHDESVLALDYSLMAGVRFFNVFDQVGLLAEVGLKNHLNLLSDGQFNGVYFNVGAVFAF